MNKEDLIKKVQDPKYISGIYNYCDRWCERCSFTSRCINYDSLEEQFDTPESHDINNKEFWNKLNGNLELALKMLKDMLEEQGINLDDIDLEKSDRQEKQLRKDAKSHPLAATSEKYADAVDQWFEAQEGLLEEKGSELILKHDLELPDTDPEAEAESIKDAIEVLRWYQYQIHIKLMRALRRDEFDDELDKDFPSDSDGSAKVALIGMDRSIAAWSSLREHFPETADDMLDMLVLLDRMKKEAEQEFPKARTFVRPGFDTE